MAAARSVPTRDGRQMRSSTSEWLSKPRYVDAYLLITRSQKASVDTIGPIPAGSVDAIERALRQSPEFESPTRRGTPRCFDFANQGSGLMPRRWTLAAAVILAVAALVWLVAEGSALRIVLAMLA
jgi:hypothetical protein